LDHIIAEKHGGGTVEANLALACFYCNNLKGPNIAGVDPEGPPDLAIQLFQPRKDSWSEHLAYHGPVLIGLTATGRGTVSTLRINDPESIEVRRLLLECGFAL
jgi:hypothetical protein